MQESIRKGEAILPVPEVHHHMRIGIWSLYTNLRVHAELLPIIGTRSSHGFYTAAVPVVEPLYGRIGLPVIDGKMHLQ